jgi:hypothetical protein
MIAKEEALKIACEYLQRGGYDAGKQNPIPKFITRPTTDEPHAAWLKEHRPDAWELIQRTHRDRWSVPFETAKPWARPSHFSVEVDAETGEVTVPSVL